MRFRDTRFPDLRRFALALPLAAALAGSAIAAPPPDTIPAYAMPQTANNGRDDGLNESASNSNPAPLPWRQLSPEQRAFLMPLRSQWNQLPPRRQQRMAGNVEKWRQLPPERQAQIQQRITHFAQMTPEERFQAANNERRFQAMPPEERQRLQDAFQRFKSLSPEQRQLLLQKFRAQREARQKMGGQQQPRPPR
jgi:Protein of unknown function (DUF3106)